MIEILKKLITIPSTLSTPLPNAPFGENLRKALDEFLSIANKMGLKTYDGNGYYGWAEIGKGDKMLAIAGHIDVVPATGEWNTPAYELCEKDGILYGRGVADDKGPIAVALKLLKKLKDENFDLGMRLRLIVGCNEENGSACLAHYVKVDEIPTFTLVPDADFPVVNSEKGILTFSLPLDFNAKTYGLVGINGGKRPNIIPDFCSVIIETNSILYNALKSIDVSKLQEICAPSLIKISDDFTSFSTYGVAGHAMCPNKGVNAIYGALKILNALCPDCVSDNVATLCTLDSVKTLEIYKMDEQSGDLTANLGMINMDKTGMVSLVYNCRLPICVTDKEVISAFEKHLQTTAFDIDFSPNLYIDKDNPIITTLLDAYCSVTGDVPHCVHTGGGTYARALPNAVAYGPTFENYETEIHNANEHIPYEHLVKTGKIYELAIKKLVKIL